jgi:4'-phosphopantetheinyl transferase
MRILLISLPYQNYLTLINTSDFFIQRTILYQDKSSKDIHFAKPDLGTWKLANDIHIWRFHLAKILFPNLNDDEKALAGRFHFEPDRNRFILGRHALRLILSKYLRVNPLDIFIFSPESKKPFISHPFSDIHFNISHSGEWILVALAKNELGVDIEYLNKGFEFNDLMDHHFSEAEQKYIQWQSNALAAFFYLWTRKEALLKSWGKGLQANLQDIDVLGDDISYKKNGMSWKLKSFKVSEDHFAAIAFSSDLENQLFFDGSDLI